MTDSYPIHRAQARTGVLLVNLGTPEAATPSAIRRYLAQFLADQRVVELPRLAWLPILYGFILPFRPRRLAHAYQSIWTPEGSPLLAISRRQAEGLRARLGGVPVALAMSYGEPSIATAMAELEAAQVRRLVVLPLYPQYSSTTTAAALDQVFDVLRGQRRLPELRTINSYHDDPGYIAALAQSVRRHWQAHKKSGGRGDHLLLSFHGLPQRNIAAGDPYEDHCRETARLLAGTLQLKPDEYTVAFQSRFGKLPWVQPYTQETIVKFAGQGLRNLDVICPGFAADCLETLEEVAIRYAADFAKGGGTLRYIPALNDITEHLDAIAGLLRKQMHGSLP